jgi:hypothetical protein
MQRIAVFDDLDQFDDLKTHWGVLLGNIYNIRAT